MQGTKNPGPKNGFSGAPLFAVAPMMDRTDRHCRFFHRQLTRRALLFTEMVTADAVIHGDREALLGFHPAEHPIALQLGGSNPVRLAEAARIGADFGYDEINLNVGCPSGRVQSGQFGACLMLQPDLVAACVVAIRSVVDVRVTVKCRLGVDDQDPEEALDAIADAVVLAGVDGLWVHARRAWLSGLSPKQNRTVPPLDHERVNRLKQRLPDVSIGLNGGLSDLTGCREALKQVDAVMLGRAVYDRPEILLAVDRELYGDRRAAPTPTQAATAMIDYTARHCRNGAPIGRITRHMVGLFRGTSGARTWRRALTLGAADADAGPRVILQALAERDAVAGSAERRAHLAA